MSLRIHVPMQAEHWIRQQLRTSLPSLVKNPDLVPLFGLNAQKEEDKLIIDLSHMSPFNPLLAHYCYKVSNLALGEIMAGGFGASRSIWIAIRELEELSETIFTDKIKELDLDCFLTYIEQLRQNEKQSLASLFLNPQTLSCSTLIAQHLGGFTWLESLCLLLRNKHSSQHGHMLLLHLGRASLLR